MSKNEKPPMFGRVGGKGKNRNGSPGPIIAYDALECSEGSDARFHRFELRAPWTASDRPTFPPQRDARIDLMLDELRSLIGSETEITTFDELGQEKPLHSCEAQKYLLQQISTLDELNREGRARYTGTYFRDKEGREI